MKKEQKKCTSKEVWSSIHRWKSHSNYCWLGIRLSKLSKDLGIFLPQQEADSSFPPAYTVGFWCVALPRNHSQPQFCILERAIAFQRHEVLWNLKRETDENGLTSGRCNWTSIRVAKKLYNTLKLKHSRNLQHWLGFSLWRQKANPCVFSSDVDSQSRCDARFARD